MSQQNVAHLAEEAGGPVTHETLPMLYPESEAESSLRHDVLAKSRRSTSTLVNLVSVMERMDEQIVPAVSRWMGCAFDATPAQISTITFSRALVQALTSPLGGVSGHYFSRIRVIFVGCLIWGTFTLLFSTSTSVHQGSIYWAFNGIGLSLIIPSCQSLIADYYPADSRGTAFGALQLTGALGGMLGSLYATSIGAKHVGGIAGWRFAFVSVGLVSMVVGMLTLIFGVDPLNRKSNQLHSKDSPREAPAGGEAGSATSSRRSSVNWGPGHSVLDSWLVGVSRHRAVSTKADAELWTPHAPHLLSSAPLAHSSIHSLAEIDTLLGIGHTHADSPTSSSHSGPAHLKLQPKRTSSGAKGGHQTRSLLQDAWKLVTIPTFVIIILQGIVGSTPWNALVFLTLYLQLLGMSDATAGSLLALFIFGTANGSLLGGWLGDCVSKRFPNHGRIFLAQFSVAAGIPFTVVLLKGLPMNAAPPTVGMYAGLLFFQGTLISWAGPTCNAPIFADIVPMHLRNMIYAFDRGFEGSISALGAPLVGYFAQHYFGFVGNASTTACNTDSTKPLRIYAGPAHMSGVAAGAGARVGAGVFNSSGGSAGGPGLLGVETGGGGLRGSAGLEMDNLHKAVALGNAMLFWMVVPWTLCVLTYTGLHWTYPRDKRRAAALFADTQAEELE